MPGKEISRRDAWNNIFITINSYTEMQICEIITLPTCSGEIRVADNRGVEMEGPPARLVIRGGPRVRSGI